jgi:hypothetical protein
MKKEDYFMSLLIAGIFFVSSAFAQTGATFTTSVGATFNQIDDSEFGSAWIAEGFVNNQDGTVWSAMIPGTYKDLSTETDNNGNVLSGQAFDACTKLEASLPTADDYFKLLSYFEQDSNGFLTEQGRAEFHFIFPEKNYVFATATIYDAQYSSIVDGFNVDADIDNWQIEPFESDDDTTFAVRCIHR